MVAGLLRQVVVLYGNVCMGIGSDGLSSDRLRRVVVIKRWSFKQVRLYLRMAAAMAE